MPLTRLIITADDYGYRPSYDAGILAAAREGLLDGVGAMVLRPGLEPGPLLESGVPIGLHLELEADSAAPRAGDAERGVAREAVASQLELFGELFGRPPAYIDGHRHAHARAGVGAVVADAAAQAGIPTRSIDPRHRRLLRCRGVRTPDLLLGRLRESEPALPAELDGAGEGPPHAMPAVVEWMTHPGLPDPDGRSSYDAGRAEDLALLRRFRPPPGLERSIHAVALSAPG
jgi:predicted glycoside hydrolase/deacetylase ChbG (UPF0249 family)